MASKVLYETGGPPSALRLVLIDSGALRSRPAFQRELRRAVELLLAEHFGDRVTISEEDWIPENDEYIELEATGLPLQDRGTTEALQDDLALLTELLGWRFRYVRGNLRYEDGSIRERAAFVFELGLEEEEDEDEDGEEDEDEDEEAAE